MIRSTLALVVCCVLVPTPPTLRAEDPQEVKNLKKEIELLKKENELLKKEIELLKVSTAKLEEKVKDGDRKFTVRGLEFELLGSKVENDAWRLGMAITSQRPAKYLLSFESIVCYTEDGNTYKVNQLPSRIHSFNLNTDLKTKVKIEIGNVPAKFTTFTRVELYLNTDAGTDNKPVVFKNVKVER